MTVAQELGRVPRIAVLWSGLSGYMHACLSALAAQGVDLLVYARATSAVAPYDASAITAGLRVRTWETAPDEAELGRAMDDFRPDWLMVCSWHIGAYRRLSRRWRRRTLRLLCMDNQWWGTPKQVAGVIGSRAILRPTYDAAFVCGERQALFARKLGFPDERLLWGLYCCDYDRFAAVAEARGNVPPERAFLYVGRLVPEKGLDVLAVAYPRYRASVVDPWPLLVAGVGSQADLLTRLDGVEMLGFVQPADLPGILKRAGCLVLPSRFEPWAVAIHEAAAAGLPIVCTSVCGASTRFVVDGTNGVVVSAGSAEGLTAALGRISNATDEERQAMGSSSRALAQQHTPERWARYLLVRGAELREELGLPPVEWSAPDPPVDNGSWGS